MIALDWTRMGQTFCIAGVVEQEGRYRVVRPLPAHQKEAPVRNVGWSAFQLGQHGRWDFYELISPRPAPPVPPHLEDVWVNDLRPQRRSASPEQRRAILAATTTPTNEPLFGAPLAFSQVSAYLPPCQGSRSLTTVIVHSDRIRFGGSRRSGMPEADFRVTLPLPEIGERTLPVKDHHLQQRVEQGHRSVGEQVALLQQLVRSMGEQVAVRLGLSRPFVQENGREPPRCWLMADGFFSLTDPQA